MPIRTLAIASAVAATAVAATAVAAQAQQADPIAASRLSAELFALAQAQDDALLMIAAARLRKQVSVDVVERLPEQDGAPPGGPLEPPLTWLAMLESAAGLAAENPVLSGLIDDIRVETTKGVRTGRVESYASIRAGGTNTYRPLEFRPGVYADVYVEGSGAADLNIMVRDGQQRLVCSDTGISAIAYCGWLPETAEAYSVEVVNRGGRPSAYKLMTN